MINCLDFVKEVLVPRTIAGDGSEMALQLFTILGVCFIKSLNINLFSVRIAKTGTKLKGIWWSRKKSQFVIPFYDSNSK